MACHCEHINFTSDELTIWWVKKNEHFRFPKKYLLHDVSSYRSAVHSTDKVDLFFLYSSLSENDRIGNDSLSDVFYTLSVFLSISTASNKAYNLKISYLSIRMSLELPFLSHNFFSRGNQWVVLCNRPFIIA